MSIRNSEFFRTLNRTWLAATAFLVLLFLLASSQWFIPISDYDFWWHIKTGQYILEHKSLPDKDPFSFTYIENQTEVSEWPIVILKSYWLSQVILYLVYMFAGALGIIMFKALVFFLIIAALWRYLIFRSASQIISFLMLVALIFFSKEYMTERPQIFSFLFATVCFIVLDTARAGKKSYLFLPLLMLLWANMHGGFLVGIAFILIYTVCLVIKKQAWKEKYPVLFFYFLSILITLLNPASYHTATGFMSVQGSTGETLEFRSPLGYLQYLNSNWYPLFGFIILSYIVISVEAIRLIKRKSSTLPVEHVLLLLGTSLAAFTSMRYGYFFMIIAVPILAVRLSGLFSFTPGPYFRAVLLLAVLSPAYFSPLAAALKTRQLTDESFVPFQAVEFIKAKALFPKIYNDIVIGGYMIWKLYPDYKVFSYTGTSNPEIYRQYMSILRGNTTTYFGVPEWKALLDMYGIRTIIHGTVNPYSGEIYPLMINLLKDEAWHLVYFDGIMAIMTRDMQPGLTDFPRTMLLRQMRWEIERGLNRLPNHPGFLRSLDMLSRLN